MKMKNVSVEEFCKLLKTEESIYGLCIDNSIPNHVIEVSNTDIVTNQITNCIFTDIYFRSTIFPFMCFDNVYMETCQFSDCNLNHVEFKFCTLEHTVFTKCSLIGTSFLRSDLRSSTVNLCDVRDIDLRSSSLNGAYINLSKEELKSFETTTKFNVYTSFFTLHCPEEGSFIGFKKTSDNKIVKLLILEDSKRSSATSSKCRASKVKVLDIFYAIDENQKHEMAYTSFNDKITNYIVGETIEVNDFNEDRWVECSTGIHFFITKQEAVNW